MNDPTGVQSALGIEAVELFTDGGGQLTVRVTGRWRRRRPAWSGQPMLLLDAAGSRHRFPAMPEPPSLTGAVPGTWRMSFSVPASFAHELGGRTWLQFGAVVVPLPMAVEPSGFAGADSLSAAPDPAPHESEAQPGDDTLSGRRLRSSELAAESARRRAAEAEGAAAGLAARIEEFEQELVTAREESERLSAALTERERARRAAEQRAHAEQALRLDLEQELAARDQESALAREALGDLAAAEERVRDLEQNLEPLRRRADEAEQLAAAAAAARERAELRAQKLSRPAEPAPPPEAGTAPAEDRSLSLERDLIAQRDSAAVRRPSEPISSLGPPGPRGVPGPASPPGPPGPPGTRELRVVAQAPPPPPPGLRVVAESPPPPGLRVVMEPPMPLHSGARAEPPAPLQPEGRAEPPAPLEPEARAESPAPLQPEARAESPAPPQPSVVAEPPARGDELRPTIEALRRELETRASAEARLRAQIVMAQGRLEARAAIESELSSTLAQLRGELDGLRFALERERAARERAERRAAELAHELTEHRQRSEDAYEAIEDLRGALEELRALQVAPAPTPDTAGPVEPERLSEAFSRLRASTVPTGGERAHRVWLAPVFTALARHDAASAGRLLLDLLPAQRSAYPHPVAYDLVLGEAPGVVQVTVRDGPPEIRQTDSARQLGTVDFQVVGGPASIARRLTAHGLRRRFGRRIARVRGNRDAFAALAALVQSPLHLGELDAAGVRMAPPMALTLVSLMIDPAWTAGQRFTIAHVDGEATAHLTVSDRRPPTVTAGAPAEPATTTIVCPADSLLLVLAGGRPDELEIRGEERPLALLLEWAQRAQSG
jgi:hypothetical protein